jgi:threonine-phosphate decarboxylase
MTKRFAIPGLRLGYIIAPSTVIDRLRANYRPWAVNALAIEAGRWLLDHEDPYYREEMKLLLSQAKYLQERLRGIFGIHVYPSSTNFMLCSIQQSTAAELKEYLLSQHGFLIRDASNFEGLSACHFRIATQLPEFNDELVKAIKTFAYKVKRNA